MSTTPESAFFRFVNESTEQLDGVREGDKALKLALRLAREVFGADEACLASVVPGRPQVEPTIRIPQEAVWDGHGLALFLRERRPKMPPHVLVAPIRRRGRPWAVLALRRKNRTYDLQAVRDVGRVAEHVSKGIERIDQARLVEVRERIDRKVLEQLRPKDLFYQILHGLRSLTRYDHSASLLIQKAEAGPLELVAEQIAWRKGKSLRIGLERSVPPGAIAPLEDGAVCGFDLRGDRWSEWRGREWESLAEVLDYNAGEDGEERREGSILCAPLTTGKGLLGVLKVAMCHPDSMGRYEADLVRRFLPQAAVAIRHLERAATLESGMLEAERKHVMANLARGVSHDVNNAFGSVLPLVQQMIKDARAGEVDSEMLVDDLEQIETSLQVCRRIFGGMLSFAHGAAHRMGEGNVERAIESALAILEASMSRHAIEVEVDLPRAMPTIRGSQGDLEQLILNLATNARDAMTDGGSIRIEARRDGDELEVRLRDTGCGIAPRDLKRVREPFFTTKRQGSGLGLSICRSIVWNMRGRLDIQSRLGEGTSVSLRLPVAEGAWEETP